LALDVSGRHGFSARERNPDSGDSMSLGELFTGLGFVVGIAVLIWSGRRGRIATEGMAKVGVAGLLGGVLGAKLSQLLYEGWPAKVPWYVLFEPKTGGKALMGGLLIGWLSVAIAKKVLGIKRSTGDHFALALPAGEAVGRIGCHFNQCCYGRASDLPWTVHQQGLERHPTQIYSSIGAALLLAALLCLRPRLMREGDLWRSYLIGFGSIRFGLEFLRENQPVLAGLSTMQVLSLELIVFGAVGFLIAARRDASVPRLESETP
jgi:phosphatidylglycerol:prolipoprotein diacylglycerol transferase